MAWITPVYDRTEQDVENETDKGFFNSTDWNRILNNYTEIKTKYTDFFATSIPQDIPDPPAETYYLADSDLNTVCKGINIMYSLLKKSISEYITLPENYKGGLSSEGLYPKDLNNIERDLELIYLNIDSVMDLATSASIATSFGGGDGSQNNPYLITSCAEFAYLCQQSKTNSFEGKYFKITKYLNFNSKYQEANVLQIAPYSSYPFKGILDGQSFRMRLLYPSMGRFEFAEKVAMIAYTNEAIIKNIEIVGGSFQKGGESWDTASGEDTSLINQAISSTIENCKVYSPYMIFGGAGFISKADNCNITNCYVYNSQTSSSIVGKASAGFILNANSCNITNCILEKTRLLDQQDGTSYFGGFISIATNCNITNCKASDVDVKGNIDSHGDYTVAKRSGGFIGKCTGGTILKCYVQGKVTGYEHIGGFIGEANNCTIDQCYAYCDVAGKTGNVTGFIGIINTYPVKITNCYTRGSLTRHSRSVYTMKIYMAGFLPQVTQKNNTCDKCYSALTYNYSDAEAVVANTKTYGIGYVNATALRTYVSGMSYYDSSLQKAPEEKTGELGYPKTTEKMKTKSTFFTFDFNKIWNINENINDGYPYLREV